MLAVGTSVWGPLFVTGASVALVGVLWVLYGMWAAWVRRYRLTEDARESGVQLSRPRPIVPVVVTVISIGLTVTVLTLGWNAIQSVTTNSSTYQSPEETEALNKALKTSFPEKADLDHGKQELRDRAEVRPYQRALKSFDESMAEEAEKIRQRSLVATQPAN